VAKAQSLDPPFNSNRDYNVTFRDKSGNATDAQLLAFEDTCTHGPPAEAQGPTRSATCSPNPPPGTSDIDLRGTRPASTCQDRISSKDHSPDSLVNAK
jgi:hypothetical protein